MRFAEDYNTIRDTPAWVPTLEVVLMLSILPGDDLMHIQLLIIQQLFINVDANISTWHAENIQQQYKQAHYYPPSQLVSMLDCFL